MKKTLIALMLLVISLGLYACGGNNKPTVPTNVNPTSVTLNKVTDTVYLGDTLQLTATVLPENASSKVVTWTSSDENIATVSSSGLVTTLKAGTVTITAKTLNNLTENCVITIIDETITEGFIFNSSFSDPLIPARIKVVTSGGGLAEVTQGVLNMTTTGTGQVMGKIEFSEALQGTIVAETRVKVDEVAFSNILYFFTNGTNLSDCVLSLAFENNIIKYHDGANWVNVGSYTLGAWYDIKVVLNVGDRTVNSSKGNFDLYVNGNKTEGLLFRNGGDGVEDNIYRLEIGSSKANSNMSYDYLRIYEAQKPTLTVANASGTVNLDENPTFVLDYTATGTPTPNVTIECDQATGYTISDKEVTFTAAGVYTFTVTATNGAGSVSKNIVVEVAGDSVAASLDILEESGLVILADNNTYELKYVVTGGNPEPLVTITSDITTGFSRTDDVITFTAPGTYNFTVTAANSAGTVTGNINVHVLSNSTIISENFTNGLPFTALTRGTGTATVTDGVLNIKSYGESNSAFVSFPFEHTIAKDIIAETRFMVNSNAFSNVLYFQANNSNEVADIAVSIAFENGNLKYHSGFGWTNIIPLNLNEWYDIKVVLNTETAKFNIYVNDIKYGEFSFRQAIYKDSITHLYIGSNKTGGDMYYDSLSVNYLVEPVINVTESEATIDLDQTDTYELQYELNNAYPQSNVTITCDAITGFTINQNTVTFTSSGTYVFTIKSESIIGTSIETITITVIGDKTAPVLSVPSELILHDVTTGDLILDYVVEGNPTPTVTVSVDKETGYVLTGNVVTFLEEGTFVFTISATNEAGTVEKTITVIVETHEAPLVIINNPSDEVDITVDPSFYLDYIVTGVPQATITVTSNLEDGYYLLADNKTIGFTKPGNYVFTITAENVAGKSVETIEVLVTESAVLQYFYNEEFNILPDTITTNLDGTATIVDGAIKFSTIGKGIVLFENGFTTNPSGIIVYETRVKVSSTKFANALFLYSGTTNVLGVALENNIVKYQNGTTWAYSGATYEVDEWITLKAVVKLGTGTFDLYVNGIKYADLSLRNKGTIESTINLINKIGLDGRDNTDFYMDYQRIYNLESTLTVERTEEAVVLSDNPSLSLNYTLSNPIFMNVSITCDKETGFNLTDNNVTFDTPGVYVFTIKGTNAFEIVEQVITVTVTAGAIDPVLEVIEDNATVDIVGESATYELLYTKNDATPLATLTITCDKTEGFILNDNLVTFTNPGVYVFTLEYANENSSSIKTITVNVTKTTEAPELTVQSDNVTFDMNTGEYTLDYVVTGIPTPEVTITSDKETVILNGNKVTFLEEGTYIFTIRATNSVSSIEKTITVVALRYEAPEIILPQITDTVNLSINPQYVLDYQVTGNEEPSVTVTSNMTTGFVLLSDNKTIGFTTPGVYQFTITAENIAGTTSKTIEITVTNSENINYFFNDEFVSVPLNPTTTGTGTLTIEDEMLNFSTTTSSKALIGYTLPSNPTGVIVYETRVKVSSTSFSNVLFLYSGTVNVLGISLEGNAVKYQNGTSWVSSGATYNLNEWLDLKAVVRLGTGRFDLYVNGILYADLSLRSKGQAEFTIDSIKNIGIDNRMNTSLTMDYMRLYNLAPEINVASTLETVSLSTNPNLTLNYSTYAGIPTEFVLTCDKTEGFTLNGKDVTFTAAGTYVFTITGTNAYSTVSKEITVEVSSGNVSPVIDILEDNATVDLAGISHDYRLLYATNVAIPSATLTITSEQTGFVLNGDVVTFLNEGVYVFTLTYSNGIASDIKMITVNVIKSTDLNYLLNHNFDDLTKPDNFTVVTKGTGTVNFVDNVTGVVGGAFNIVANGISNSTFVKIPFESPLNGIVVAETRFMVGTTSFSNALFFFNDDLTNNTIACVAFENGNIKYHSGGGWTNLTPYQVNTWYDLKMVLNTNTAKFDLYVDGVKFGNLSFRQPTKSNTITHLYIGSDKANTSMYYDDLQVYYVPQVVVSEENTSLTISLAETSTFTLQYNVVSSVDTPVITCDKESGFTLTDNQVTFTETGVYTFTITASNNSHIASSKTIVITVTE